MLAAKIDGADPKALRETVDRLKEPGSGPRQWLLATVNAGKVALVAGVTKDCTDRIEAGMLANHVARARSAGAGAGVRSSPQAGGNDPSRVDQAISSVQGWVREQLAGTDAGS